MRCKICDSIIHKPVWNNQLKDWEVCTVCLDIINNIFEDPVLPDQEAEEALEDVDDEIVLDNTA
jgi:tRNA G26 N,N-dimethylase Trm1